jgi:hypothetical protein
MKVNLKQTNITRHGFVNFEVTGPKGEMLFTFWVEPLIKAVEGTDTVQAREAHLMSPEEILETAKIRTRQEILSCPAYLEAYYSKIKTAELDV